MHINIKFFARNYWPYFTFLLLVIFVFASNGLEQQYLVLTGSMILLPMFDRNWKTPTVVINRECIYQWLALMVIVIVIISLKPDLLIFFFSTLIFAAIPEEWFFRAYLMERAGKGVKANIIASVCFAALHAITLSWVTSLLVFVPSLLFGWIYQKRGNIVLLVLIHAVSNLVYAAYLYRYF